MKVCRLQSHYTPLQIVLESKQEQEALVEILQEHLARTVSLTRPTAPFNFTRSIADRLLTEVWQS